MKKTLSLKLDSLKILSVVETDLPLGGLNCGGSCNPESGTSGTPTNGC